MEQHPLKDGAQTGDLELENPKAHSSAVLVLANGVSRGCCCSARNTSALGPFGGTPRAEGTKAGMAPARVLQLVERKRKAVK